MDSQPRHVARVVLVASLADMGQRQRDRLSTVLHQLANDIDKHALDGRGPVIDLHLFEEGAMVEKEVE